MFDKLLIRCAFLVLVFGLIEIQTRCEAQLVFGVSHQAKSTRGWTETHSGEEYPRCVLREKTLLIHAAVEVKPALKYRLIPSEYDRGEGNAAVHYLRAMAFLERTNLRQSLDESWKKASQEAVKQGKDYFDVPPYSWQNQSASELPLSDVKEFLRLTDFQVDDLAAARMLKNCDFNRNILKSDNPYAILLPEVQQMRELARNQSLRCRVAVAERRFEDAFAALSQQYSMANHLSQDTFVVSLLVGNAIAGIAWEDALDFVAMPQSPNLYWALATLPKPVTPIRNSFDLEKQLPFLQFKALQEVDEKARSTDYWNDFIDRILVQYNNFVQALLGGGSRSLTRFDLVNLIAAGYPGARHYLMETEGLDPKLVDALPMAQIFFLAQRRYLEHSLDERLKWSYLDYSSLTSNQPYQSHESQLRMQSAALGWAATPAELLGPAILQVRLSSIRIDSQIALLQTIEAIRMYAAENGNQLPKQLSDLPYPAPLDPSTSQPITYQLDGDTATLTSKVAPIVYRLNLQIAK